MTRDEYLAAVKHAIDNQPAQSSEVAYAQVARDLGRVDRLRELRAKLYEEGRWTEMMQVQAMLEEVDR
ncbi:MAG: hypothetical protein HRU11_13985 [Parvularculaceae bacterium]|nr:hypothetical protein [Parvularculaceae bacterium]